MDNYNRNFRSRQLPTKVQPRMAESSIVERTNPVRRVRPAQEQQYMPYETEDDIAIDTRRVSSRNFSPEYQDRQYERPRRRRKAYREFRLPVWMVVGSGMILMGAIIWAGFNIIEWGVNKYNDIHYGNPRTYQVGAVVGHNDSPANPSHFIAQNINKRAVVVEMKGGDATKSVSYIAPYDLPDASVPVEVRFKDVDGDGKPDMIMRLMMPTEQDVVFLNTGKDFRPATAKDKVTM